MIHQGPGGKRTPPGERHGAPENLRSGPPKGQAWSIGGPQSERVKPAWTPVGPERQSKPGTCSVATQSSHQCHLLINETFNLHCLGPSLQADSWKSLKIGPTNDTASQNHSFSVTKGSFLDPRQYQEAQRRERQSRKIKKLFFI